MSRVLKIDEEKLLDQYEAGDETARDKIIIAYKPMVNVLVKKVLLENGILKDMREDLQQAGMLGLVKAFGKFDRKRGCKFSTYAYPYAQKEIYKEIYNTIGGEEKYLRLRESKDYVGTAAKYSIQERDLTCWDLMYILKEKLTQRELDVCKLLLEDENMNNVEIGDILGITRERVRQIRKGLQSKVNLRLFLHGLAA